MWIGIVAFIVALTISIALHEAGHLLTAKAFGMKASEYFIGFGKRLWSFRRGETEYGVKAIPAGGYVKIVGMTQLEELDPADERRAFWRQPAGRRAVVLGAGSFMHFVIGAVLLFVVLVGTGIVTRTTATLTVDEVAACVPATATAGCTAGAAPGPAKAAGLQPGDRVVAFQGRPVTSWEDFTARVRSAGAGPAELTVVRDGRRLTLRPDIVTATRPTLDPNDGDATERVGVLGIASRTVPQVERYGPLTALGKTGTGLATLTKATFTSLGSIPAAVPKLFTQTLSGQARDASGLVGPVGAARVSGQAIASPDVPLSVRISDFLLIIAGLNIFVGIFNLLPLLPLDGGHLAVLAFEQARSGLARLLGRADPGRVDLTKLLPVAYLVVALFIGLSVVLLFADVVNPVANPFG